MNNQRESRGPGVGTIALGVILGLAGFSVLSTLAGLVVVGFIWAGDQPPAALQLEITRPPQAPPQLTVDIDAQGEFTLNGKPTTAAGLESRFEKAAKENPRPIIVLRSRAGAAAEKRVIEICSRQGVAFQLSSEGSSE